MNELDAFLDSMLPKLEAADTALHNGDASARIALWSHHDPVTLFGAAQSATGWEKISATFDWLASPLLQLHGVGPRGRRRRCQRRPRLHRRGRAHHRVHRR